GVVVLTCILSLFHEFVPLDYPVGGPMKQTLVRVMRISLVYVFALGAATTGAQAQVNTADLKGIITDPSGAVVGDAKVRVESLSTGRVRETTTRESGDYHFLALPPGHYKISVEATHFRPAVAQEVELAIGQQAQLPFRLEISSLEEALVVTANPAIVESSR